MGEGSLRDGQAVTEPNLNRVHKQRRECTLYEAQWGLNALAYQSQHERLGMVFEAYSWERRRQVLVQFGRWVGDVSFVVRPKMRSFVFGTRLPLNIEKEYKSLKDVIRQYRRHIILSILVDPDTQEPLKFAINGLVDLFEDDRVLLGPEGELGRWQLDVVGELAPHIDWWGQTDDDGVHWDCAVGELAKKIKKVNQ